MGKTLMAGQPNLLQIITTAMGEVARKMKFQVWEGRCFLLLILLVMVSTADAFDGIRNLALTKFSNQPQANDGNYDTLAHVRGTKTSIWINLDRGIIIWKINIYLKPGDTIQDITVMVSNGGTNSDPSPASELWIPVYHVRGVVNQNISVPLFLAEAYSYIAIYCEKHSIQLTELEVFDFSQADRPLNLLDAVNIRDAKSSSPVGHPYRAVDGNSDLFDTSSHDTWTGDSGWWMVVLKTPHDGPLVVKIFPFLERAAVFTEDYSTLSSFTVTSYDSNTTAPMALTPIINSAKWSSCSSHVPSSNNLYYNEDVDAPIRYDCIPAATQKIAAIALRKRTPGRVVLAEVEAYNPTPADPANLEISSIRENDCVIFSWHSGASESRWKCTSESPSQTAWSSRTASKSVRSCDHGNNIRITCYVIAVSDGGISGVVSASNKTACSKPGTVTSVSKEYRKTTSTRGECKITWKPPTSDCPLLFMYKLDRAEYRNTSDPYTVFLALKAFTDYVIEILAVNKDRRSEPKVFHFKTGQIEPFYDAQVMGLESNATCVKPTWPVPKSENGVVSRYELRCNASDLSINKTALASAREINVCGFRPYTNVSCTVTARNGAGLSNALRETVQTKCAAPNKVQFNVNEKIVGDQLQISLTLTAEVVPNCAHHANFTLIFGGYQMPGYQWEALHTTDIKNYKVTIIAVNNKGMESEPNTKLVNGGDVEAGENEENTCTGVKIGENEENTCTALTIGLGFGWGLLLLLLLLLLLHWKCGIFRRWTARNEGDNKLPRVNNPNYQMFNFNEQTDNTITRNRR